MENELKALQERIFKMQHLSGKSYINTNEPINTVAFDHITYVAQQGLYSLYFYGDGYDYFFYNPDRRAAYEQEFAEETEGFAYESTAFADFIDLIVQHPDKIQKLSFDGPEHGANGTRDWDFSRLAAAEVQFPKLIDFVVQQTKPGDHNTCIMGEGHDPNPTQTGQILLKMPNVQTISIPGVPGNNFLQGHFPHLYHISVQASYDHSNFIKNLAQSKLLHQMSIDYTDCLYHEVYTPEELAEAEDFKAAYLAEQAQDQEKIAALMAQGNSKIAAVLALQKEEMLADGESAANIEVQLNFNLTKAQATALLQKHFTDQKEVAIEIESYTYEDRWLPNGAANPEYIKEQEAAFLELYEAETDLDFEDDLDTELSATVNQRTPFKDYQALFRAIKKGSNTAFWLRENYLTQAELQALAKMNPTVQFKHIPTGGDRYI